MRKAREISCRFDLDPQTCDWLIGSVERLGAEPKAATREFAIYLDTPQAAIGNRGLALSVRRSGEFTSDDVKEALAKTAYGLPAPNGWAEVAEPLSAATSSPARRSIRALLRPKDEPQCVQFQVETQSDRWALRVAGAKTEIKLERLRITGNRRQMSCALATFARKGGSARDFFSLLKQICDPEKLRLSAEGTALRGYRFCGGLRDQHVTAFVPKLSPDMDAAAAFQTIARACFDQFLVNEAAIRATRDREAVHQCRVALRRLSTALRLFSPLVSGPEGDELFAELKRLAANLQKARDLDVLIADVIEPTVGKDPPAPAQALLHMMDVRRAAAYDELVAALSAPQSLYLRLVAWIEAGDWTRDAERKNRRREDVGIFVERKLATATRRFKERCRDLEDADHEERHKIRIRAKNLRYSSEFFESLVAPKAHPKSHKRFRSFIASLKDLQSILGKENDVRMARRFLASLMQEIGEERLSDAGLPGLAIESLADNIKGLPEAEFQKKAGKARRALADIKPFWDELGGR